MRKFCVPFYNPNGAVEAYGPFDTFDEAQNWLDEWKKARYFLSSPKEKPYGIIPFNWVNPLKCPDCNSLLVKP